MHATQVELIEKIDALLGCDVCSKGETKMKIQTKDKIFKVLPAMTKDDDQCSILHEVSLQSMFHELTFDSFVVTLCFAIFSNEKFWFLEMLSVFSVDDFAFWVFTQDRLLLSDSSLAMCENCHLL